MKTWLITGCSSGFGRNLAETLLSEGEQVIVTARKPKTIQHFAKNYPLTALCLRLDVTKKDTIDATVNAAIEKFGKIDVSSTTPVIVFAVPLRNAQNLRRVQHQFLRCCSNDPDCSSSHEKSRHRRHY